MDTTLYWFWILLKFSGKYFGFKQSAQVGSELKLWALGSVLVMPAQEWARGCGSSHTELKDPLSSSLYLQDFHSAPHCSLAHKKTHSGSSGQKAGFLWVSATHVLHRCAAPEVGPPWGKVMQEKKNEGYLHICCFSTSRHSFTICLLLFTFPSS